MKKTCLWLTSAFFFLMLFAQCFGQGWEKSFGFSENDALHDLLPTADGGFLTVGYQQEIANNDRDVLLIKTDADGIAQWTKLIGNGNDWEFGKSIRPIPGGGYVIGGTLLADGISYGFITRTDADGDEIWTAVSPQDSVEGRQAIPTHDGGFALIGSFLHPTTPGQPTNADLFLMKVNANGGFQWSKNYGGSSFDEGYSLLEKPDMTFMLAGKTLSYGAGHYDVYVIWADAMGTVIWSNPYGTPNAESGFSIAPCTDGNFIIAGKSEGLTPGSEDILLLKINAFGNQQWMQTLPKSGLEFARSVRETTGGGFILAGEAQSATGTHRQVLLVKTDAAGNEIWERQFGGSLGDGANAVVEAENEGFAVAGFTNSFGAGGSDGYVLRTDSTGISLSCLVRGNVHSNLNNTCVPDNVGQDIPGYIVEIAGAQTYFGTTDADGNFSVPVPEGNYEVRIVNPSPYWTACADSLSVSLSGAFDTATVNFSLLAQAFCPMMQVDMSTLGLRRCFPSVYHVSYKNIGATVADPALVEIEFDPYLQVDSASIPWASTYGSNSFMFDVGTVQPFESGSFDVFLTVDCNSALGQTHCSEAHILPDSLCLTPDPNWDGASIQISATCEADSVRFTLTNVGGGNMAQALNYIVIEDFIMGYQGSYQLTVGQDTTFILPANGSTFRLEADQSPGHPGNSLPSVAVEGCGGFNPGFVVQYPLNDADLSVDADCRENTGSFDPNDKQAAPLGYGEQHFIEPNTDLEYLIRFQNTGTDTAFSVIIRDTLSDWLDPRSVEPGASSHAYEFEVYNTGILKFTFDNILLPDSNVNEPASHGFVKFRVKQRRDNPVGTLITNHATIYFDFNAPIVTNQTYHNVATNFIAVDPALSSTETGGGAAAQVKVYPNPFDETALFELENAHGQNFRFRLFDVTGGQVREEIFSQNRFQFQRGGLPGGVYFFRIETEGKIFASGKVVLR